MNVNHGANIFDLCKLYNINKEDLMDFSSNINPFGSSNKAKKSIIENIEMVSLYPDPMYKELKNSISDYCKCKKENIILGSGATELISSFIKTISPKKALLLSPAYSEYESELNKIGCLTKNFITTKENNFKVNLTEFINTIKAESFDLIIICNPNNPTGFAFTNADIKKILNDTNIYIMIDETYIEFTKQTTFSSANLTDTYSKLFVIRGTSKFFATPGIRLGYGLISDKSIQNEITKNLDLWNINIFATLMGEIMFKDKNYIKSTYEKITKERDYLANELKSLPSIKVFETFGNFILCEILNQDFTARLLYEKLIKHKIIIRDCSSFEGLSGQFFRVCILTHEENMLLIEALKETL
ncbi:MAG: pyridoxal phosphate-dependent aminotransferase [Sarcina sp.]